MIEKMLSMEPGTRVLVATGPAGVLMAADAAEVIAAARRLGDVYGEAARLHLEAGTTHYVAVAVDGAILFVRPDVVRSAP